MSETTIELVVHANETGWITSAVVLIRTGVKTAAHPVECADLEQAFEATRRFCETYQMRGFVYQGRQHF